MDFTRASVDRIEKYFGGDVVWTDDMESVRQLDAYLNGRLYEFSVPLDFDETGTDFQRGVWRTLMTIPYGETITYAELAVRIGNPGAVRAVGQANNRNPIAIVIPCHRVIRTGGDLGGYNGGLARKRALLSLERARAAAYRDYAGARAASGGVAANGRQGTTA